MPFESDLNEMWIYIGFVFSLRVRKGKCHTSPEAVSGKKRSST